MEHVFVKLGGSFITHKDRPVSINYFALKCVREIFRVVAGRQDVSILAGNGGGSFAHYTVLKHAGACSKVRLVKCQESTRILNRIVVDYLVENGILATSVQTSSIIHYDVRSRKYEVFTRPLETLMSLGVIPVVYGECIPTTGEPIIVSTEKVFELISEHIKPKRIVLLTDVSGVYTCDPKTCRDPVMIDRITPSNVAQVLEVLKQGAFVDATGGMFSKVKFMASLAERLGIQIVITSGFDVDSSINAILGGEPLRGTTIYPE